MPIRKILGSWSMEVRDSGSPWEFVQFLGGAGDPSPGTCEDLKAGRDPQVGAGIGEVHLTAGLAVQVSLGEDLTAGAIP